MPTLGESRIWETGHLSPSLQHMKEKMSHFFVSFCLGRDTGNPRLGQFKPSPTALTSLLSTFCSHWFFFFLILQLSPSKLTLKSPFFLDINADPMAPTKCQKLEVLGLDTWQYLSSDQPTETCSYQLCEDTNLSSLCVTDLNILWRYPCKYINFSIFTDESLITSWQWFLMQISQRPQQATGENRKPSSNNQPMTPLRGVSFW